MTLSKPVISTQAQTVNAASFTLSGTAEVGATIQILHIGSTFIGAIARADNNGNWSLAVETVQKTNICHS